MNILCIESFCPKKRTKIFVFRLYTSQPRSQYWLLKPASEHAHAHAYARLVPRLSWSWTVLLPRDTYRKPIISIATVLLSFGICLSS
jgi:hypothetical protein